MLSIFGATHARAVEATYHGQNNIDLEDRADYLDEMTEAGAAAARAGSQLTTVAGCNCGGQVTPRTIQDPGCYNRYMNLYPKDQAVVNFNVAFGYEDTGPGDLTTDPYMAEALATKATTPCPATAVATNTFLCGFHTTDDATVFEKTGVIGPDGTPHTVHLTIVDSSLTSDDAANRSPQNLAAQNQKSLDAQNVFMGNLCNTDATFYVGHGRGGSGPGFYLPTYLPDGSVNYAAEEKAHHTMENLSADLKKCTQEGTGKPKFMTIESCAYPNFAKDLKTDAPNMNYQLTSQFGWNYDDPTEIYGTLNGLLGEICEPGFSQMVDQPTIDPTSALKTCYPVPNGTPACFPK